MEYWVFQPEENITAYELALITVKLKKIPKSLPLLMGISDSVYDSFPKELQRHFRLYSLSK